MSTLLFIRHAETDMAGRFCGYSDPPVNERGHRQIEALLRALDGMTIDAVYSSDLLRALTTSEAIAVAFRIPLAVLSGLREINFGDWEGLTWEEIERQDVVFARRWCAAYPQLSAPGGESFESFQSRVLTEVMQLPTSGDQRCMAIVTHGGVMRVVLRVLCGLDEEEAWERTREYCGFFRYKQREFR